jgi:hypothetical protein
MTENLRTSNKGDLILLMRKWLGIVLYASIVGEMIFFPSWANLAGCIMELIVWHIFRAFFLKKKIILEHPFSFLAFLSMFLARYIPLPATLLEAKPITYGFEVPFETFFWETLMFIVASLAFYFAIRRSKRRNNLLQRTLYKLGFFETDATTLWILGLIGLAVRLQQLSVAGEVEFGDVNNKFLAGLIYLQYTPIIMLFPKLSGISFNKRRNTFVLLYTAVIFLASFATNSRQAMIYPIFTITLLFFLHLLKNNISIFNFLSPVKIIFIGIAVVFGLNFVSDISLAMLANRKIRKGVSAEVLFDKTVATLQNEAVMEQLRNTSLEKKSETISYSEGWDETYLNNFMLNRYGNLRVSDQTLYYVDKVGYSNEKMQESFVAKAIAILPSPLLAAFGIKIDKNDLIYSPGDMLYMTGGGTHAMLGGFRVTSLIADGLATFGYLCFPILFILLFLSFILLDSLVLYKNKEIIFSIIGLINIFGFLGMFRNSISSLTPLIYILRGFWQQCFTLWIVVFLVHLIPFDRKKARARKKSGDFLGDTHEFAKSTMPYNSHE